MTDTETFSLRTSEQQACLRPEAADKQIFDTVAVEIAHVGTPVATGRLFWNRLIRHIREVSAADR